MFSSPFVDKQAQTSIAQECSIERERVFPVVSDKLRFLPEGISLFHAGGAGPIPCRDGC